MDAETLAWLVFVSSLFLVLDYGRISITKRRSTQHRILSDGRWRRLETGL